jgi:hypothetical protein
VYEYFHYLGLSLYVVLVLNTLNNITFLFSSNRKQINQYFENQVKTITFIIAISYLIHVNEIDYIDGKIINLIFLISLFITIYKIIVKDEIEIINLMKYYFTLTIIYIIYKNYGMYNFVDSLNHINDLYGKGLFGFSPRGTVDYLSILPTQNRLEIFINGPLILFSINLIIIYEILRKQNSGRYYLIYLSGIIGSFYIPRVAMNIYSLNLAFLFIITVIQYYSQKKWQMSDKIYFSILLVAISVSTPFLLFVIILYGIGEQILKKKNVKRRDSNKITTELLLPFLAILNYVFVYPLSSYGPLNNLTKSSIELYAFHLKSQVNIPVGIKLTLGLITIGLTIGIVVLSKIITKRRFEHDKKHNLPILLKFSAICFLLYFISTLGIGFPGDFKDRLAIISIFLIVIMSINVVGTLTFTSKKLRNSTIGIMLLTSLAVNHFSMKSRFSEIRYDDSSIVEKIQKEISRNEKIYILQEYLYYKTILDMNKNILSVTIEDLEKLCNSREENAQLKLLDNLRDFNTNEEIRRDYNALIRYKCKSQDHKTLFEIL